MPSAVLLLAGNVDFMARAPVAISDQEMLLRTSGQGWQSSVEGTWAPCGNEELLYPSGTAALDIFIERRRNFSLA